MRLLFTLGLILSFHGFSQPICDSLFHLKNHQRFDIKEFLTPSTYTNTKTGTYIFNPNGGGIFISNSGKDTLWSSDINDASHLAILTKMLGEDRIKEISKSLNPDYEYKLAWEKAHEKERQEILQNADLTRLEKIKKAKELALETDEPFALTAESIELIKEELQAQGYGSLDTKLFLKTILMESLERRTNLLSKNIPLSDIENADVPAVELLLNQKKSMEKSILRIFSHTDISAQLKQSYLTRQMHRSLAEVYQTIISPDDFDLLTFETNHDTFLSLEIDYVDKTLTYKLEKQSGYESLEQYSRHLPYAEKFSFDDLLKKN